MKSNVSISNERFIIRGEPYGNCTSSFNSNFLFSEAAAYCNSKDIDFKLLGPLMKQTVHNALDLGPDIAQTGPARRGDTNTIKTHIASLESISQKKIYQYISDAIQDKYKHEL